MMSMNSFDISGQNAPAISEKIVASTLNAIQPRLPENKIEQVCEEVQYAWRDRVLPPAVTVLHMILAALWPEESFNAGWQVQWAAAASRHPDLAGTMTMIAYALGGYCQSEWALALTIPGTLRKGDLLIADRYFAAAHYFWRYQSLGLEFLTRTHQRLIVSRIKRVQSYSRNDFLGWLTIHKHYRKKDRTLPEHLLVRFVQATSRIRGTRQVIWLATSLLDAKEYPAAEIVQLYGRRWRIETAFEQLKVRLSADVLRSHSPEGIRKEFAARCIALNLVHSILLEAASLHHVDPMRISFAHAVRAILIFSPALACEPVLRLPQIYRALISEIAHHLVPERPGRMEPRAVRREHKHYPALTDTRAEWRSRYAA